VPEKKFQFGRGKNFDAVVARFEVALENAKFKADSDEIAMAPMYIGTVPKNRNPLNGIHADHFNGFRFMFVGNHVFLISCPNNPHAVATVEVVGQVWTYARGVVPQMNVGTGGLSSATRLADVSMRRNDDVPAPSLIAGLSTRQSVLVVEVVCSSPTSLFSALDEAATHMANNAETAAYIIFYFFKLRADRTLAMVAIDVGRGAVPAGAPAGTVGAAEIQQFISFGTATPRFATPRHGLHDAFLVAGRAVRHFAPNPAVAPPSPPPGTNHNFHGAGGVATTLTIVGARLHRPGVDLVLDVSHIASHYYREL
jgi:hypothetical protein